MISINTNPVDQSFLLNSIERPLPKTTQSNAPELAESQQASITLNSENITAANKESSAVTAYLETTPQSASTSALAKDFPHVGNSTNEAGKPPAPPSELSRLIQDMNSKTIGREVQIAEVDSKDGSETSGAESQNTLNKKV